MPNTAARIDVALPLTAAMVAALCLHAPPANAQSHADELVDSAPPVTVANDTYAPTPQPPHPSPFQPMVSRRAGITLSGPYDPHFRGGLLFDSPARDLLRVESERGRRVADVTSNVALWSLVAAPFLNAGVVALGQPDAMRALGEMELVNAEAFGLSLAVTWGMKALVGRERPYATAAGLAALCRDPEHADEPRCRPDRNASFLSGHSAMAFTGAGLLCAQSGFSQGTDSGMARGMCGVAMAAATTTALLRIGADMHYATDTLAGAALGLLAGFAMPVALHYADNAPLPVARSLAGADQQHNWAPMVASAAIGIAVAPLAPVVSSLILRHQRERPLSARNRGRGFDPRALNVTPTTMPNDGGGLVVGGTF